MQQLSRLISYVYVILFQLSTIGMDAHLFSLKHYISCWFLHSEFKVASLLQNKRSNRMCLQNHITYDEHRKDVSLTRTNDCQ